MSPSIRTMGFFMSEINFCNTKEQLNHLGEVVTGKVDGSPSGAPISTSTLPYTGQVRKALPALESEYEQSITSKEAEADAAIDEYRLLNKGPYASGIALESKFEYITYNGESYFATNPPYTTTSTTPDADGNLFAGGYTTLETVASKIGNPNLLSNSNFLTPSPEAITHPNATPESYAAGTQVFSGVYAGPSGATVTLIDGRVNCSTGSYEYRVPNTNGLDRVPVFTSSVSDYDGNPVTAGVSHALVTGEYIVTVTPAAGDVFSVKLEQGGIATRHEVGSLSASNLSDRTGVEFIPNSASAFNYIQSALATGKKIRLEKGQEYQFSGSIVINDSAIDVNGASIAMQSNIPAFIAKGGDVKVSNTSELGVIGGGLLQIGGDCSSISLSSVTYRPGTDQDYIMLSESGAFSVGAFTINQCKIGECSGSLLDLCDFGSFTVKNSKFNDCYYRLIRLLNENNGKISFRDNEVNNLTNGSATGSGGTARVLQVEAENIFVLRNDIADVRTTEAGANLIYYGKGNLTCYGNTVKNMTGTTFVIHDKGLGDGDYKQNVYNNTFEWDGTFAERPEAVVHTLDGKHMMCNNNTFIKANCQAMTVRKTDLPTNPNTAKTSTYKDNLIYDHDYPIVVNVLQASQLTDVSGNTVYGLTNTTGVSDGGLSQPSLVYAAITGDLVGAQINVSVSNNKVYAGAADSHILATNKQTGVTKPLKASCDNNELNGGDSYVFVRFQEPDRLSITNNIGEGVTSEYTGTSSTPVTQNNYLGP